jgi:uncharacterized membrane protein YczE
MERKNLKYVLYFVGCILFSLGATFFIASNLGTNPLDVFTTGIRKQFGLLIGTTQSLFAIACLIIWTVIYQFKRIPPISTFLTFFLCGYLIDFFLFLTGEQTPLNSWIELSIALLLCTEASALIIMSGFGIRAMDLVAIALTDKTGLPFWVYKGIAEVLLFTTGWALGGAFGIGTIAFLFFVGWLIQPFILINQKLGVPNFGPVGISNRINQETIYANTQR